MNPEPAPRSTQQLHFDAAFDSAAIGMILIAMDGPYLRVNQAMCRMLGYSEAELLAQTADILTHPDDVAEGLRLRDLLLAGRQTAYHREKRFIHRDGHLIWTHLSCTLERDAAGQPLHFTLQVEDITQRKAAERALRDSEERFRSLTLLTSDWFWEQDAQMRFTLFSGGTRAGYADLESNPAIGRRPWELENAIPVDTTWAAHQAALLTRQPFRDFRYMRDEASGPRYYSVSGEPVFDAQGEFKGYRGTAADITQQKLDEQRLRETQAMLHLAAQIGRLGAWEYDLQQTQVTFSPEVCAIHGLRPGYRPTPEEAHGFYTAAYREPMRRVFSACLRDGTPFDVEAQITTARGEPLWVRVIGEAQWDAQGRVRRMQGAFQDISESRRAAEDSQREILRLNAELEQRVRERTAQLEAANKELEAFSYSIAHDLRAPLGSIDGFSQMLEQDAGAALGERSLHFLRRIRAGVRQMSDLTDGLLELSKLSRASLRREPVDLAVLARAALAACREEAPGRRLDLDLAASLPAQGDPRLLSQVMGNLVGNAWKFTRKMPHARISIGGAPGDAGATVFFVRDNGDGFDMAHAGKMFEAFQRMHTTAEFEGNGIGLAIVHKIVVRHGGRIWAEAAPRQGACFYFTLGHASI